MSLIFVFKKGKICNMLLIVNFLDKIFILVLLNNRQAYFKYLAIN